MSLLVTVVINEKRQSFCSKHLEVSPVRPHFPLDASELNVGYSRHYHVTSCDITRGFDVSQKRNAAKPQVMAILMYLMRRCLYIIYQYNDEPADVWVVQTCLDKARCPDAVGPGGQQ